MLTIMKWILASQSPRRRQLLEQAGVDFDAINPPFDDPAHPEDTGATAEGIAMQLSFQKALSVQKIHPDRPIIAADTLIVMPDQTLAGTPTSSEQAGQMIRKMLNTAHWVVTGVTLLLPEIQGQTPENKRIQFADRAQVTLGNVSNSDLDAYLDTGNWQGKAGGYNLFDRQAAGWPVTVNGDQTTVVGLPMAILMQHLKDM
ncbi:MAG TPA: septum formation protein Maf [Phycisphaerales bacterium]|nr:septum formation protein Maf [Phycisphaerales bacterium]HCD34178.1 septum formation protein Maf [Phycisphaerales bacterium]|tara:strand:+ start:987 stop:1589 length:603 start_codon:yes stop_codon:yes gene_type:complete